MPELESREPYAISDHEARRIELQEEQGIINHVMAEAEATGVYPSVQFGESAFAQGVKAEKKHRRAPTLPGLEAGAISGMDQARLKANEEYEAAKAEGRISAPPSKGYLAAKAALLIDLDKVNTGGDPKAMIIESQLREHRSKQK